METQWPIWFVAFESPDLLCLVFDVEFEQKHSLIGLQRLHRVESSDPTRLLCTVKPFNVCGSARSVFLFLFLLLPPWKQLFRRRASPLKVCLRSIVHLLLSLRRVFDMLCAVKFCPSTLSQESRILELIYPQTHLLSGAALVVVMCTPSKHSHIHHQLEGDTSCVPCSGNGAVLACVLASQVVTVTGCIFDPFMNYEWLCPPILIPGLAPHSGNVPEGRYAQEISIGMVGRATGWLDS